MPISFIRKHQPGFQRESVVTTDSIAESFLFVNPQNLSPCHLGRGFLDRRIAQRVPVPGNVGWISRSSQRCRMLLYGLIQIFLKEFLYGAVQFFFATDILLVGDELFLVEEGAKIIAVVVSLINVNDANIFDLNPFAFAVFAKAEREGPIASFLIGDVY